MVVEKRRREDSLIKMVFILPLAIWLGILTIISLFITAGLGIAMHVFSKPVFRWHKFFAGATVVLALLHLVFAYLLWSKGVLI